MNPNDLLMHVSRLLSDETITRLIDDPIDRVTVDFLKEDYSSLSDRQFMEVLQRYIDRLTASSGFFGGRCKPFQTSMQTVDLLSTLYQGTHSQGYAGALDDFSNPQYDGVNLVICKLAESIKSFMKQQYQSWVKTRFIDSLDWDTKRALAEMLYNQKKSELPPDMQQLPLARLAHYLFELLCL